MSDWQINTFENPFYAQLKPVEVMYKDGKIRRLDCPKCARGLFKEVVKWRKMDESKTP